MTLVIKDLRGIYKTSRLAPKFTGAKPFTAREKQYDIEVEIVRDMGNVPISCRAGRVGFYWQVVYHPAGAATATRVAEHLTIPRAQCQQFLNFVEALHDEPEDPW